MSRTAKDISHWLGQMYPDAWPPQRPSLERDEEADVCIVGAGYGGLWTAYSLLVAEPSLRVVVLEAEIAGYGAAGRNGGAVIALAQGTRDQWAARAGGPLGAQAFERALFATVDEIGATLQHEGIDCSFNKAGVLEVARTPLELGHFRHQVERDRAWGFGEDDYSLLEADAVQARVKIDGALGARFTPHCASMNPGRLVRGLAEAVERRGGVIYEGTRVTRIDPSVARTARGAVRARFVIRATEAYTESLETHRRLLVPIHTTMLATEPIPSDVWAAIGWAGREAVLAEHPFLHLQHTADGRITIGGDDNRIPYRYGSQPSPLGPGPEKTVAMYHAELVKLFPALRDVPIASSWQGVFAAPRSWMASVGLDRATGTGWVGGYVGEGVALSNLCGRTLADLILGRETELTRLPLVQEEWGRRWEPEPLRYAGSALIWAMRAAGGRKEVATDQPSRLIQLGNRLAGYQGMF